MKVTARIRLVVGLLSFLLSLAAIAGTASVAADVQQRKDYHSMARLKRCQKPDRLLRPRNR